MNNNSDFNLRAEEIKNIYSPFLLRLNDTADKALFESLLEEGKVSFTSNEIYGQLQELIKGKYPSRKIKAEEYPQLIENHLAGKNIDEYGVWVYYPWSQRLVHLLDEEEFTEVRTNRNQYKITRHERDILSQKRIGVVGLSVGQSIALTLAMERGFGELRLADFDELELSNLNRIRTGVHNLGIPKVVIAAREIAEIDPFLKITCFFEGLTEDNMDDFFLKNGKLDIFVDECDGLDMKIISRFKARELGIPVIMDTSDRGMLDVERFDLEPERPLLHGTIQNVDPKNIKGLSNEDKIPVILQMLGVENLSLRAKVSMIEVEQTINTWPQLASSVALGGALGADVCRRILLDQFHESGRYYIDLEELVADEDIQPKVEVTRFNPFSPLSNEEVQGLSAAINPSIEKGLVLEKHVIEDLVKAACAAPSTGNDQPWKWVYHDGVLNLFHDEYKSFSFGDFHKNASFITFGAAFENLYVHALKLGYEAKDTLFPVPENEKFVASITFQSLKKEADGKLVELDEYIYQRHTNRNPSKKEELSPELVEELRLSAESVPGATFKLFTQPDDLQALSEIIGACDRMRLLHPDGHYDFVHREIRWTMEDAKNTNDGIYVETLGLSHSQLAAMDILKNEEIVNKIKELDGGYALDMLAKRTVATASALCIITFPQYNLQNYFEGGRSMERFWLTATKYNQAIHPLISPFYLIPRITHGKGEGLDPNTIKELTVLRSKFQDITGFEGDYAGVFIAKIALAEEPELKAFRLPLEEVLIID